MTHTLTVVCKTAGGRPVLDVRLVVYPIGPPGPVADGLSGDYIRDEADGAILSREPHEFRTGANGTATVRLIPGIEYCLEIDGAGEGGKPGVIEFVMPDRDVALGDLSELGGGG